MPGVSSVLADFSPQLHGDREGKDRGASQKGPEEETGPQPAGPGDRDEESPLGPGGHAARG